MQKNILKFLSNLGGRETLKNYVALQDLLSSFLRLELPGVFHRG